MLVVANCPRTHVLISQCGTKKYIFSPQDTGFVHVTYITPDRRRGYVRVPCPTDEARHLWRMLRRRGYYQW